MAKNYAKKEGKASLIFIWILIILIAVATFFVVKNYKDNHSDLLKNDNLAAAFSEALEKPIGKITANDLAAVEAVAFIKEDADMTSGSITLNSDTPVDYVDYAIFYVGEKEIPVSMDQDDFILHLPLFTGIKEISVGKNSYRLSFGMDDGDDSVFDLSVLSADKFKNLETISAQYFDVKGFDTVASHTGLKNLFVYNAGITDISPVKDLTKLESLVFNGAEIKDISALANLTELKSLNADVEGVTDISVVKGLTKLETLALSGTGITDISAVAELASLKSLAVTNTSVATLPSFEKLTNLEELNLSANKLTDITALSVLSNEKITSIDLTGNDITDYTAIAGIDESKIQKDPEETDAPENEDDGTNPEDDGTTPEGDATTPEGDATTSEGDVTTSEGDDITPDDGNTVPETEDVTSTDTETEVVETAN